MIFDHLSNLHKYKDIIPHLEEVLDFLNNNDIFKLKNDKYIINDNVFIMRQSYIGKDESGVYPEKHNNYLDIQAVLKGYEVAYYDLYNDNLEIFEYKDVVEVYNNETEELCIAPEN